MATESIKLLGRLKRLESQLSRLAKEMCWGDQFPAANPARLWQPPTDVYETDSEVVVCIEAAGLRVEDISIELHPDVLVVRAVRREPRHDAKCVYRQFEIRYGVFERVLMVPRNIHHEAAEASYSEGFLVIRIPKRAEVVKRAEIIRLRI